LERTCSYTSSPVARARESSIFGKNLFLYIIESLTFYEYPA
jgi:hypothetical protein